ncbi:hypothetical protein CJA_3554 [Cellvibrio japonicus Ueda107]|uniref:Uncharacterized protein n=1 Tax=Cellvibrio japonicus (strain Ueda107) TaxID=498211 RepID=B3PGV9_CELJU|nr:hypothetical protein CJA_3554 [Cellvibrio japonicus Ueda107]
MGNKNQKIHRNCLLVSCSPGANGCEEWGRVPGISTAGIDLQQLTRDPGPVWGGGSIHHRFRLTAGCAGYSRPLRYLIGIFCIELRRSTR